MKSKYTVFIAFFFTLLLFGGGRLLATTDTLWQSLYYGTTKQTQFSPDDSLLAVFETTGDYNSDYQRISLIDPLTGNQLRYFDTIQYPKFTPNGRYLVGYRDSDIVVVRVDSMIKLRQYDKGLNKITYIDISQDGNKIYAIYEASDTNLYYKLFRYSIWDINTGQRTNDITYDSCDNCSSTDIFGMSVSDSLSTIIIGYRIQFGDKPPDPRFKKYDYNIAYDV